MLEKLTQKVEETKGREILTQADDLIQEGKYQEALALVETINNQANYDFVKKSIEASIEESKEENKTN